MLGRGKKKKISWLTVGEKQTFLDRTFFEKDGSLNMAYLALVEAATIIIFVLAKHPVKEMALRISTRKLGHDLGTGPSEDQRKATLLLEE